MRKTVLLTGIVLLPLAFAAIACGDETTKIENVGGEVTRGISVSGEGKVTAAPDMAVITIGVSVLKPTVAEARDAAALSLDAMIASMKANGVAEKDIQTQALSIYPEYDYRDDKQTLRGYRVQNTVVAKIRDLDKTSDVIDGAVTEGGDNATIQGISFTIDDPESLREEARTKAIEDAKRKAQTLADASGVEIGEPITISEGGFAVPVLERGLGGADAAAPGVSTPIEPGELDVVVNVSVTWEIKQ